MTSKRELNVTMMLEYLECPCRIRIQISLCVCTRVVDCNFSIQRQWDRQGKTMIDDAALGYCVCYIFFILRWCNVYALAHTYIWMRSNSVTNSHKNMHTTSKSHELHASNPMWVYATFSDEYMLFWLTAQCELVNDFILHSLLIE